MSKIEVNAIEPQCGTTLTLGASGDTVALASGASQTGFGRTGTVDWITTPKTATFTAVSGEGYFANTSGGAFTMNLPAGVAGAIVSVADYTRTFQTNNLTITPNGSEKVGGVAANFVAQTEGQSITLIYVDATEGWINTTESTGQAGLAPAFITACGGTPTTVGDYKIHTFTGPGTFTITCAGNPLGSDTVDYLAVAGGGGGGSEHGGAGGAGGYRESSGASSGCYSASPLGACVSALPVTAQAYPIAVGGGGPGGAPGPNHPGTNGSVSSFSSIISTGGGGGGTQTASPADNRTGATGGSGGGSTFGVTGAAGNTPPVSPPQGNAGGNGAPTPISSGGGGGGASAVGTAGGLRPNSNDGGVGGAGATSSINNTPTARAGGGGGGPNNGGGVVPGGIGGGGAGGGDGSPQIAATAGTVNTGGGGGGGTQSGQAGAAGGSGIVIIRYKFQ